MLTNQALANLVFGLQQLLAPPLPSSSRPAAARRDRPGDDRSDDHRPDGHRSDGDRPPTRRRPTRPSPTTHTSPTRRRRPFPSRSRRPPRADAAEGRRTPAASATIATLDAQLVDGLGLGAAAAEFAQKTQAAGLTFPWRFGTEVVGAPARPAHRPSRARGLHRAPARRPGDARGGRVLRGADHAHLGLARPDRAGRCRLVLAAAALDVAEAHPRHGRSRGSACRTCGAGRATAPRSTSASPRAAATTAPASSGACTS